MAVPPGDELPPEEQDWHRFQQLDHLGNHWQRPGWVEGRRSYHWLLTFERAFGLQALAAQCQAPFRDLQFDLVPLEGLHLTLQRVAFTDELPSSSLPTVLATARRRCQDLAPFWLQIGWLAGSTGAIRFTALPIAPIAEIHAMTATPTSLLMDTPRHIPTCTTEEFWPHVSIAYSNSIQLAKPVISQVKALRHLPPVEILVTSVALVELRREGRVYRWEELERAEMGI